MRKIALVGKGVDKATHRAALEAGINADNKKKMPPMSMSSSAGDFPSRISGNSAKVWNDTTEIQRFFFDHTRRNLYHRFVILHIFKGFGIISSKLRMVSYFWKKDGCLELERTLSSFDQCNFLLLYSK